MNTKEKVMILTLWIVLLILLTAVLIKVQPKIIEKIVEIKQDCPIQTSRSESVYLVSEKEIKKLPFCALMRDDSWDYCYDWAYWDGHSGVSIINLKFDK